MRRTCLTALLASVTAFGLGACGGDDTKDAEQTVRDFVKATNAHDGDKLCDDLLSEDFIEAVTGATGDNAKKSCKQQFEKSQVRLGLGPIKKTKVDGDNATVTAEIETRGQKQQLPFKLEKEDGEWRLAGGTTQ